MTFQLAVIAIVLLILSIPFFVGQWLCRFLPRLLALIFKVVLVGYGALVALAGVIAVGWAVIGSNDECLERHFTEGASIPSPEGKRRAVVSSGVCVTGLTAVNSYDGVDVEIENPDGGRVPVFRAVGGMSAAPRLEWLDEHRLKVTLGQPLPVISSQKKGGAVSVEYHLPTAMLVRPDNPPPWFDGFVGWAGKNGVGD